MSGRPRPKQDGERGRNAATFAALFVVLLLAAGFVALTALVLPNLLVIPLVFFAFVFTCAFHYATWGWWMSRRRKPEDEADDDRGISN